MNNVKKRIEGLEARVNLEPNRDGRAMQVIHDSIERAIEWYLEKTGQTREEFNNSLTVIPSLGDFCKERGLSEKDESTVRQWIQHCMACCKITHPKPKGGTPS